MGEADNQDKKMVGDQCSGDETRVCREGRVTTGASVARRGHRELKRTILALAGMSGRSSRQQDRQSLLDSTSCSSCRHQRR